MLSDHLIPSNCLQEKQSSNYKYIKPKSGICGICSSKCYSAFTTYIKNEKISTRSCYLCHLTINFNKYHSNKLFLIESTKTQLEINKFILDYYSNYKEIPSPLKIDKFCKIINNLNLNNYFDNPELFKNIKIYFNPNVINYITDTTESFFSTQKNEKNSSLTNYSCVVQFYEEINKIPVSTLNFQLFLKINDSIKESEESFAKKYSKMNMITQIKIAIFN